MPDTPSPPPAASTPPADEPGWLLSRRVGPVDAVIAGALSVAALVAIRYAWDGRPLWPFGTDLALWAQTSIQAMKGFKDAAMDMGRPPIYPWLVGVVASGPPDVGRAAVLVSNAAVASTFGLAWISAVRLGGRLSALLVVNLLFGLAPLWELAGMFNSQCLIGMLSVAELGLAYAAVQSPRWWGPVLAGATFASMALTKEQGLVLSPLALGAMVLPLGAPAGTPWRGRLRRVGLALGGMVGLVALVVVVLRLPLLEFVLNKALMPLRDTADLARGEQVTVFNIARNANMIAWVKQGEPVLFSTNAQWIRYINALGGRTWLEMGPYHWLIPMAVISAATTLLPGARVLRGAAGWCLIHCLSCVAFFLLPGHRYHVSYIFPLLALTTGLGVGALGRQLVVWGPRVLRAPLAVAGGGLFAGLLWSWHPEVFTTDLGRRGLAPLGFLETQVGMDVRLGYPQAAEWLRAHTPPSAAVASWDQLVHVLADRQGLPNQGLPLPHPNCPTPNSRVDGYYLVTQQSTERSWWARMGTDRPPPHFEEVFEESVEGGAEVVRIYRVHTDPWGQIVLDARAQGLAEGFGRYCKTH